MEELKGVLTEINFTGKDEDNIVILFLCCRWRKVEPQDIVVNCAKMSLDPIEGTTEDLQGPLIPRPQPHIITTMKPPSKQPRSQGSHTCRSIDPWNFYSSSRPSVSV